MTINIQPLQIRNPKCRICDCYGYHKHCHNETNHTSGLCFDCINKRKEDIAYNKVNA